MAKKFKRAAKSKIEERAAGREGGGGTNLASHMASALLTGNVSGSSAEASPSLNPSMTFKNGSIFFLLSIKLIYPNNFSIY